MEDNLAFYKQVSALRKAASATSDIFANMRTRLNNITVAAQDIAVSPKTIVEKAYTLTLKLSEIGLQLNGDDTKSRREFETPTSITARINNVESGVWNSTSAITTTYRNDYAIASKGLTNVLAAMRKLEEEIQALEKQLELNKAPYTPGRWPEWK